MSALLETNELTVSYGGLHANSNVNIKAEKGKLTGLIGPNGAGKTTFIAISRGVSPCVPFAHDFLSPPLKIT